MIQDKPHSKNVFFLWLLIAVFVGMVPRLWNLEIQVLGGDELHAVKAALRNPVEKILFTYSKFTDHCIPLTAFYRLLMDCGVVMSEMSFRLPVLLSGFFLLIVFPLAVENKVGRTTAAIFALFLAVSPLMVFYSRIVRSYIPMLLLSFSAVMAFYTWWCGRGIPWAIAYVLLASVSVYLHLGAGPLVIAPFFFGAGELVSKIILKTKKPPRGFGNLLALGLCLILALAAFLVPARSSLLQLIKIKRQAQSVSLDTLIDVCHLQAGTELSGLAAIFWVMALFGLILLLRRQTHFGAYTLTMVAGHLIGLVILSPVRFNEPLILSRYILVILPFVLLWLAVPFATLWRHRNGERKLVLRSFLVAVFICALVLCGPFTDPELRATSFAHNNSFVGFISSRGNIPEKLVPSFYHTLAKGPTLNPVIECPFPLAWDYSNNLPIYQRIHKQEVLVAAEMPLLNDPRLDFRNMPKFTPGGFISSRANFLVVHLKWFWEIDQIVGADWVYLPAFANVRKSIRKSAQRLTALLTNFWGPPIYQDSVIQVWDLRKIRQDDCNPSHAISPSLHDLARHGDP